MTVARPPLLRWRRASRTASPSQSRRIDLAEIGSRLKGDGLISASTPEEVAHTFLVRRQVDSVRRVKSRIPQRLAMPLDRLVSSSKEGDLAAVDVGCSKLRVPVEHGFDEGTFIPNWTAVSIGQHSREAGIALVAVLSGDADNG